LAFNAYNIKNHNVHDGSNKRAYSIFHLLYVSSEKKNAAEVTEMICAAYGENAVSHAMCKRSKISPGRF